MTSSQISSAVSRPFELHRSALSEEEYAYYMGALSEILEQDTDDGLNSENRQEAQDVSVEDAIVTLSEVRAWLRGRFPSVYSRMVDEILRLVPAPPTGSKMVKGGQFFAVLRMMFHAVGGMSEIDIHRTFLSAPVISSPFLVEGSKSRSAAVGQTDTELNPTTRAHDRSKDVGNKTSSVSQGPKTNGTKKSKTVAPLPSKSRARIKATASQSKLIPAKRRRTVESEDDDDQDEDPADADHENSRRQTRGSVAGTAAGVQTPSINSTSKSDLKADAGILKPTGAYPCPPPDKDGYFAVADVHGSKTSSTGAIQLYISWQGYPLSKCSWEPLAALKHTDAYRRWQQMWARIKREKGLKDIQIVPDKKRFEVVHGQKQELRLVQEVGTKAKDGTWMPLKEAQAMLAAVRQAIEDDTAMDLP